MVDPLATGPGAEYIWQFMSDVRRICALVCCAVALAPLAGCGQATIRPNATAQTVTRFVYEHTGFRPTDVTCPSGVPAKVGVRFQCHFTGPEGPYTAYVRILSVHGQRVEDYIVTRPTRRTTPA